MWGCLFPAGGSREPVQSQGTPGAVPALPVSARAVRLCRTFRGRPVSLLPLGNTLRQIHGHGFLLVGDAAGLIHPCSCEGVSTALVSGRVAAETLAEACAAGDCGRAALSAYPIRLWKRLGPSFRLADRLLALRTPRAMGSLIRSAHRRPHNAGWISGVLMGRPCFRGTGHLLGYLDFLGR